MMKFDFSKYINWGNLQNILEAVLIVLIGYAILFVLAFTWRKTLSKRISRQSQILLNKALYYTGFVIILFIVLNKFGVKITALLGAAGVMGIVIGIASQTSIGNIISGLFLISEKAFEIGDVIRIGDKTGVVYSIDLLSIKLKTFDNLLIRIPNQSIISSELTNITKFPIRRLDFEVSVAYKENLQKVKEILLDISQKNPLCLDEPEPLLIFKSFGESGIDILFGVWFEKTNYLKVKNGVFAAIHERFKEENIEIPFPHISLYAGEASNPLSITLTDPVPREDKSS